MRNPLGSEAEAYRFLGVVIVAAAAIIAAAYINTWLGVAVAVLFFVGLGWWLMHEPVPGAADPATVVTSETPPGTHRVLVVAPPGTGSCINHQPSPTKKSTATATPSQVLM